MNKDHISEDTIAAISTPEGEGGIAVIRISGGNSEKILHRIFKKKSENGRTNSRKRENSHKKPKKTNNFKFSFVPQKKHIFFIGKKIVRLLK